MDDLKRVAKDVSATLGSGVVALALEADEPQLFVTVSDDLMRRGLAAGDLVRAAMPAIDGKGGGRPGMAQGKGSRREGLAEAMVALESAARQAVDAAG
jgi:alanyl-tRNA synthetase